MATFNLDYDIDLSKIDALTQRLRDIKAASKDAADGVSQINTKGKSNQDAISAGDRFIANLQRQAEFAGKTKTEVLALKAAKLGIADAAAPYIAQIEKATAATHSFGLDTAGARRELLVLAHEASQGSWKNFGGSLMVMAEKMDITKALLSPLGLGIGAVTLAIGALAVGAYKGAHQQSELNAALLMTGNVAGGTATQLIELSRRIGESTGHFGEARDAILLLAQSGRYTQAEMDKIGTAAVQMSKLTGESVESVIEKFKRLAEDPLKQAVELNKQYHFLNATIVEQIAILERKGDKELAASLAEQALADATKDRYKKVADNAGILERAGHFVARAWGTAWDAIMGIGRSGPTGLEGEIAKARKEVEFAQKQLNEARSKPGVSGKAEEINLAAKQAELHRLEGQAASDRKFQAMDAERQAKKDGEATAASWWEGHRQQWMSQAQLNREQEDLIRKNGETAGRSPAEIEAAIAGYRSKHVTQKDRTDSSTMLARMRGELQVKKVLYEADVANLDAAYKRGEMSAQAYEHRKAALTQAELDNEIAGNQKMLAAAKRYGDTTKVQQAELVANIKKLEAEKTLARANELKAAEDHAKALRAINETALREAANFNAQRKAAMDKSNRQLYMTQNERQDADAREAIELKYNELVRKTTQDLNNKGASAEQVRQAIADLRNEEKQALDDEAAGMEQRSKLQSNWKNGAVLALKEYQEKAADVAGQTKGLFTSAFQNMEDALVNFATGGKLSFGSLAKSIIADLIRMELKAEESKFFTMLGGMFGLGGKSSTGSSGGGLLDAGISLMSHFAANGAVIPSMLASGDVLHGPRYLAGGAAYAGEAGAEGVLPLRRMTNGNLGVQASGAAGGGNVTFGDIHVVVQGNIDSRATADKLSTDIVVKIATQVADSRIDKAKRRGGMLNR